MINGHFTSLSHGFCLPQDRVDSTVTGYGKVRVGRSDRLARPVCAAGGGRMYHENAASRAAGARCTAARAATAAAAGARSIPPRPTRLIIPPVSTVKTPRHGFVRSTPRRKHAPPYYSSALGGSNTFKDPVMVPLQNFIPRV